MKHFRVKKFVDFSSAEIYYGIECKMDGKWLGVMDHAQPTIYEVDYEAEEMCDLLNIAGTPPRVIELPEPKLKVVT